MKTLIIFAILLIPVFTTTSGELTIGKYGPLSASTEHEPDDYYYHYATSSPFNHRIEKIYYEDYSRGDGYQLPMWTKNINVWMLNHQITYEEQQMAYDYMVKQKIAKYGYYVK